MSSNLTLGLWLVSCILKKVRKKEKIILILVKLEVVGFFRFFFFISIQYTVFVRLFVCLLCVKDSCCIKFHYHFHLLFPTWYSFVLLSRVSVHSHNLKKGIFQCLEKERRKNLDISVLERWTCLWRSCEVLACLISVILLKRREIGITTPHSLMSLNMLLRFAFCTVQFYISRPWKQACGGLGFAKFGGGGSDCTVDNWIFDVEFHLIQQFDSSCAACCYS